MTDDSENKDVASAAGKPRGPLAGERLAEARRKQQITVVEVAKELHLDEMKVRALEQNNFDALGAPVFAKGHLKKYAQLVGVEIDELLGDYYELNRSASMPPVVGKVRKQAREITPGPWVAAVAVLVVVAAAYWFFVVRDVPPPSASLETGDDAPQVTAIDAEPDPASAEDGGETGQAVAEQMAEQMAEQTADEVSDDVGVASAAEDDTAAAGEASTTEGVASPRVSEPVSPPPADGEVRLTIRFSGDCWTEITDASGRRLYFDLGRNGRTVNVSGRGPLSVLFGNAEFVRLAVNGDDYDIAPADRRGRTARLTIYAP